MNASDLAKTQSPMTTKPAESGGIWASIKNFATDKNVAPMLTGLAIGGLGAALGGGSEALAGGLTGGLEGGRWKLEQDRLDERQRIADDLARAKLTQNNALKGNFGTVFEDARRKGLLTDDAAKDIQLNWLKNQAKDPYSLQQQQYASQYGAGLGKLETAGQIESAKTMGREQAQMGLERQEGARASQGRVNTIDSLIRDVEQNPNVVGIYSPLKETAGRLTGGRIGFNEQQLQDRGNLVRGIGQMQNEILAAARAAGQSGINTISEIRQATKGINENSSPEELIGALQRMRESETRLNERLSGGQQSSGSKYKIISVR